MKQNFCMAWRPWKMFVGGLSSNLWPSDCLPKILPGALYHSISGPLAPMPTLLRNDAVARDKEGGTVSR